MAGSPTVYSNKKAIEDAYKLANLKPDELVLDLGCGNGRSLLIAAEKFGAKGVGIERSPFCYLHAKLAVYLAGQSKNVKILFGDLKIAEKYLKKADVIYLYLLNSALKEIETWFFQNLSSRARVVSLAFIFPNYKPKSTKKTLNLGVETTIQLYIKE